MIKTSDPFEVDIKSIDWSPDGTLLVVGGEKGIVFAVNAVSLMINNKI